ncbi:hypothetical protein CLV98_104241 [Dyadobacter jejuensis]|uniref:DUF4834 domain-containing protein n=1 Tax=Dyadobacter jejuensis TaxID=1082580 RepID=A0A316ALI1_9BACT|nr:DUF4834 domain-containing protein [Dyadobacter jejuensis]PWJ58382.1 hypothetical protein CLV98_104241 [Dyadobacter jejuensis]
MKIVFNILLIFFLLIAFVPMFRRFIFHLLVGRQLVKEQKKQYQAYKRGQSHEGVRVDKSPPNNDRSDFKGGEYVDYEEIK